MISTPDMEVDLRMDFLLFSLVLPWTGFTGAGVHPWLGINPVSSVWLTLSFLFLTQRINCGKPPSQQTKELGFFFGTKS